MKSIHSKGMSLLSVATALRTSKKQNKHVTKLRSIAVVLVAALSLIAASGPANSSAGTIADEIHYTITGANSVSFDWRGDPTTINFGLTSAYGQSVVAGNPVIVKENGTSVSVTPNTGPGPFREARLAGLQPGTTYHLSLLYRWFSRQNI
jgi:hypothetical protein